MYAIKFTGEFKRQMKICERRGYDMELLREAISILSKEGRHQITAKSSAGTFVVTVTISGNKMTWNGTASNGVTFHYVFQREV